MTSIAVLGITLAACSSDDTSSTGSATLNEVTDRGVLNCGVKDSQPGFGFMNPDGVMEGNDVEYCKAIAAAVLGDASKVNFVPASAKARFDILAAKEIDVLIKKLQPLGLASASRTGVVAMTKGSEVYKQI